VAEGNRVVVGEWTVELGPGPPFARVEPFAIRFARGVYLREAGTTRVRIWWSREQAEERLRRLHLDAGIAEVVEAPQS